LITRGAYYYPSSTRGLQSEAMNELIDLKYIPKKCRNLSKSDSCSAGYYCSKVEKSGYKIYVL
jgi:hypothetical protein